LKFENKIKIDDEIKNAPKRTLLKDLFSLQGIVAAREKHTPKDYQEILKVKKFKLFKQLLF
jgi:hypothetical protein